MKASVITLCVAGLLLAAVTVLCAQAGGPGRDMQNVTVKSTGTLTAKGTGQINVMALQGSVTIAGTGMLAVSPEAKVAFTGKPGTKTEKADKNGNVRMVVYEDFDGKAVVTGEKFSVHLRGKATDITAIGAGQAMLMGEGSYTVQNDGEKDPKKGEWAARPEGKKRADGQPAEGEKPTAQERQKRPEPVVYGVIERQEKENRDRK